MNISFFKTPKHKVFNYTPVYYDERKEHREKVKQEALREKAIREGKEWKDPDYKPGKYISGAWQDEAKKNRKHALGGNMRKYIGLVSMIIFFLFLIYFAEYFQKFLEIFR